MQQLVEHYSELTLGTQSDSINQYTSYLSLLQDPLVEVVVITVPSGIHGYIAKEALRHSKHVVVEKPLCLSITEAREISKLADELGLQITVCHQKRFHPHLRTVKRMIQDGGLGVLIYGGISLFYNRNDSYYGSASWRGTWQLDGGMLMNQAIHNIDLLLWMMGSPTCVDGKISRLLRQIETEDSAIASLKFENGALGSIAATVCAEPRSASEEIVLIGSQGKVKLAGKALEPVEWVVSGWDLPIVQDTDAYRELYRDFHDSIRHRRSPFIHHGDCTIAMETILAIYQSSKSQSATDLPITNFGTADMLGSQI